MKIKMGLLTLLLNVCLFGYSQTSKMQDLRMDNYIIRTVENSDKTFGFQIVAKDHEKPIIEEKVNPYSKSKTGFIERQNAVVVASWYVKELQQGKKDLPKFTLSKAKELGITQKDLN